MADESWSDQLSEFKKISEKPSLTTKPFSDTKLSTFSIIPSIAKPSHSTRKMNDVQRLASLQNKESRVMRFLGKVNHFIIVILGVSPSMLSRSPSPIVENKLVGRVHQFQKEVEKTVSCLKDLRVELEQDKEFQFPSLVTSVIDPLIKEIYRLKKAGDTQITPAQQVRESEGYVDWIEKAKKWIELCYHRHTCREAIDQAFISHTYHEFRARIDKDLQVIQDYLNVFMTKLDTNDLVKIELKDLLEQELSQHIFELYLLKDHSPHNSIESLNSWRAEADIARESCFSIALHVIDSHMEELIQPTIFEEGEDPHIVDIHERLSFLEQTIVKFDEIIREFELYPNEEKKKACVMNLSKMEDEAHSLNVNLQLTHDHVARVQHIIASLSAFHNRLH
ncbi:MAG: hypothetical protein H0X29_01365 [Parachlamydiaceae bacterium]|nr:hypothetical protein [Parachlamydiaceae bacterium]